MQLGTKGIPCLPYTMPFEIRWFPCASFREPDIQMMLGALYLL